MEGYSPWGCKEWGTTEQITLSLFYKLYGNCKQKLIQIHKKWGKETTKHNPSKTLKEETETRQDFNGTAKAIRKQLNGNKRILTKNYFKCKQMKCSNRKIYGV